MVETSLQDYVMKPWLVTPFPPLISQDSAIKMYSKTTFPEKLFSRESMATAGSLISEMLQEGKIKRRLGVGFGIVSDHYINVSIWGGEFPSLLNNDLFGFDKVENMRETLKPLDVKNEGTYCVWELGIVEHEVKAWKKFLHTQRKPSDLQNYIHNSFQGTLI